MKDLRRKTRGEVLRHIGLQKDRTYCIFAMVSDKDKMATVAATSLTPQRAYKQLRDNAKTHQQGYRSMTATDEFLLNYTVDVRLLEQGVTADDVPDRKEVYCQKLKVKGYVVTNLLQKQRSVVSGPVLPIWEI